MAKRQSATKRSAEEARPRARGRAEVRPCITITIHGASTSTGKGRMLPSINGVRNRRVHEHGEGPFRGASNSNASEARPRARGRAIVPLDAKSGARGASTSAGKGLLEVA